MIYMLFSYDEYVMNQSMDILLDTAKNVYNMYNNGYITLVSLLNMNDKKVKRKVGHSFIHSLRHLVAYRIHTF
jgi:hypothetical protein